ncbi:MAG: NAD(P)-dependent oxidoreductase [Chloroflexi bacterium]|nr:NAD(P)-dependent oxidoreductase [Chloroflexota bacterium]MDA1174527.1 NAD(P)-dependent oxidoreductase [Chloroflexota bacterium]
MNVGFIGLGKMGGPMARNLINAGHTLVVNDVNEAATAAHRELGATWAATPREVAGKSEVIFTSLPGPAEVDAVALGGDGLIEGITPGAIYVDLSTGSPTAIRRVAERIEAAGAHVVDAPVSGGVQGADKGTLAVMVGGAPEIVERIRPMLEVLGGSVVHVGDVGSGTVAKLVHNAISMTTRIVIQEGMALAVKAGVDANVMLTVLREASFGKQLVLTDHIPDLVLKGDFDHPRFSLGLSHKDVSLALELAREMEVPMAMAQMADEEIRRGIDRGWADRDNLVTFLLAEERAGVVVRDKK